MAEARGAYAQAQATGPRCGLMPRCTWGCGAQRRQVTATRARKPAPAPPAGSPGPRWPAARLSRPQAYRGKSLPACLYTHHLSLLPSSSSMQDVLPPRCRLVTVGSVANLAPMMYAAHASLLTPRPRARTCGALACRSSSRAGGQRAGGGSRQRGPWTTRLRMHSIARPLPILRGHSPGYLCCTSLSPSAHLLTGRPRLTSR